MTLKSRCNAVFSLTQHIGTVLSESEYHVLLAAGRIYTTFAYFYEWDAKRIIGDHHDYRHFARYGGEIVADSWEDARQIALDRGWGEVVNGRMIDAMDDRTSINDLLSAFRLQ